MDEDPLVNWRNNYNRVLYRHHHFQPRGHYAQPWGVMGGGIDETELSCLGCSPSCSWTCHRLIHIDPTDHRHIQTAVEPSTEVGGQLNLHEWCIVRSVLSLKQAITHQP